MGSAADLLAHLRQQSQYDSFIAALPDPATLRPLMRQLPKQPEALELCEAVAEVAQGRQSLVDAGCCGALGQWLVALKAAHSRSNAASYAAARCVKLLVRLLCGEGAPPLGLHAWDSKSIDIASPAPGAPMQIIQQLHNVLHAQLWDSSSSGMKRHWQQQGRSAAPGAVCVLLLRLGLDTFTHNPPCAPVMALQRELLHPHSMEHFLSTAWEQQPLHIRCTDRCAGSDPRSCYGSGGELQLDADDLMERLFTDPLHIPHSDANETDPLRTLQAWCSLGGQQSDEDEVLTKSPLLQGLQLGSDVRLLRCVEPQQLNNNTTDDACHAVREESAVLQPSSGRGSVTLRAVQRAFRQGFSCSVRAVGSRVESVRVLEDKLRTDLGVSPGTNLYLTPPSKLMIETAGGVRGAD